MDHMCSAHVCNGYLQTGQRDGADVADQAVHMRHVIFQLIGQRCVRHHSLISQRHVFFDAFCQRLKPAFGANRAYMHM